MYLLAFALSGAVLLVVCDLTLIYSLDILPGIIIFVLYSVLVLHARLSSVLLWSLVNCLLLGITTISLSSIISTASGVALDVLFKSSRFRIYFLVLNKLFQLLLTELSVKFIIHRIRIPFTRSGTLVSAFVAVISICVLLIIWGTDVLYSEGMALYYNVVVCGLLLCVNLLLLFFFVFYSKAMNEKNALQTHNRLVQMQLRNQREMTDIYGHLRVLKHDMSHHLHTLHGYIQLGEYEKADQYIQAISADVTALESIHTGNITLDALLGSKTHHARLHNIQMEINALVPERLSISDDHLSVIIGNLFNNAFDACLQIPDTSLRNICIEILYKHQNLVINFANSTNGTEKKVSGTWLSTKQSSREHGYGLKSIDRIIDQYGGYCQREHASNIFSCRILLPCTIADSKEACAIQEQI